MISINNINKFLLYFLPISLIIGSAAVNILVSLICVLIIYTLIKEKKNYYFINKYFIFFILWCLYLILLSITSDHILLSLGGSLFYFRFGLFSLPGALVLGDDSKYYDPKSRKLPDGSVKIGPKHRFGANQQESRF